MTWADPLKDNNWSLPIGKYSPGGFGYKRDHSVHTGVDLYSPVGTKVYTVESGKVVNIEIFTGPRAKSPWYNETYAVLVEGNNGVVLYGEIAPNPLLEIGKNITQGECIGEILSVLKENKGNGKSMLHLELYKKGTKKSVWWHHGKDQPKQLLDPTFYLLELKIQRR